MTIDDAELNPATAHAAALGPGATARGIAFSAVAVAYADMQKINAAFIRNEDGDEILSMISECEDQLRFARNMMSGTIWTMPQSA